jgi:hypothetical protein
VHPRHQLVTAQALLEQLDARPLLVTTSLSLYAMRATASFPSTIAVAATFFAAVSGMVMTSAMDMCSST